MPQAFPAAEGPERGRIGLNILLRPIHAGIKVGLYLEQLVEILVIGKEEVI
jgi:hypothetical protein